VFRSALGSNDISAEQSNDDELGVAKRVAQPQLAQPRNAIRKVR
jgi:hypothetical protein